jgi:N-acyl-D-amino-acid deacylase
MIPRKVVLLVSFLAIGTSAAQQSFDVLVQGGRIIDGSGNPWYEADVGIRGERVIAIGDLSGSTAERVIDASGLVVSPGFIDPHTTPCKASLMCLTQRAHYCRVSPR